MLLLGESAARGFLYDPDFNPAKALEAALPALPGSLGQSAGKRDRHLEATALREQGALGLKELREQSIAAFVDILRRQLTELSASRPLPPTSRYPWVSCAPRDTDFTLNCRQRGGTNPGECQVRINGTCVIRLPLTSEWNTLRFSAPGNLVQSGVNWLEIEWPVNLQDGEEEIGHAAREHEDGRFAPLLPTFAEISSLSVVQR